MVQLYTEGKGTDQITPMALSTFWGWYKQNDPEHNSLSLKLRWIKIFGEGVLAKTLSSSSHLAKFYTILIKVFFHWGKNILFPRTV